MKIQKKSHRRFRPRSVTILAWLALLDGLVRLGFGLFFVLSSGAVLGGANSPLAGLDLGDPFADFLLGLVQLILAVPLLWVAIGLFRLKSWAWMWAMALQGLYLLLGLIDYLRGQPHYVSMVVSIAIVLYLNTEEVRDAFRPKSLDEIAQAEMGG